MGANGNLYALLTAPLWNWNMFRVIRQRQREELLTAPLWNWNWASTSQPCQTTPFNRTTLELKHRCYRRCGGKISPFNRTTLELKHRCYNGFINTIRLLTAPLWNWNRISLQRFALSFNSFNRTTLELKPIKPIGQALELPLLTAPLWNWNSACLWPCPLP